MKVNAIQHFNVTSNNFYGANKEQQRSVSFCGKFVYNKTYENLLSAQAADNLNGLEELASKYFPLLKKCKGTYEFREEGSRWLHTSKEFDYGLYKDNKLLATGYVLHMPKGISAHIGGMIESFKESILEDLRKN